MRCSGCGNEIQPGLTRCPTCSRPTELPPPPPPPSPQPQWQPSPQPQWQPSPQPQWQPAPQQQYGQYPPQGQYPPYGAPPPAQGGSTLGKVIVILVIVVVAIIVAGAIMVALFLGAVEDVTTPDDQPVTVNLGMPNVQRRDIDGTPHWDSTSAINKVTPRDADVQWSSVRVFIRSSSGGVLLPSKRPLADDPPAYDNASDGRVDVEVWFIDVDLDGLLEAGDSIKVTGMTSEYEGSTFEMVLAGERIASASFPTDFP